MKILLIYPNNKTAWSYIFQSEPLGLEMLASTVPHHQLKILDLRVEDELQRYLREFQPDVVGITGQMVDYYQMIQCCGDVRKFNSNIKIIVGGYHATFVPKDFYNDLVDIIVLGEGEATFKELIDNIQKKDLSHISGIIFKKNDCWITTSKRELVDLNCLPLPRRDLIEQNRIHYYYRDFDEITFMETTRGCKYRCSFCPVWKFQKGTYRKKTPVSIMKDLKEITSQNIFFIDDNFFQCPSDRKSLYKLIKKANIKKQYWMETRASDIVKHFDLIKDWVSIGTKMIHIGFENINNDELKKINKNCSVEINNEAIRLLKEIKMPILGSFIIDPRWRQSNFDDLTDYILEMGIDYPVFTILTPFPGTDLFEDLKKSNYNFSLNYKHYDLLHTTFSTKMPLKEFAKNMVKLHSLSTLSLKVIKDRVRDNSFPLERMRSLKKEMINIKF